MVKVNITTLGCPKNVVDSIHLKRAFISEGFVYVDDLNDADILLVNTCGFIKEAKEESIEEILRLTKLKENGKKLLVFGCLAKRYRDELLKEIPEIDSVWGMGEEKRIIEDCKKLAGVRDFELEAYTQSLTSDSPSYAYLKIAEGCDKRCTFCVIPSIRGRFRSISPEDIIKEAEEYIEGGVRELILVAQDTTTYGKEFKGYNLLSLLKDIVSISGNFWVRLLYLYPIGITDELLEYIANEDKIQKYLDIPLQHSEDKILRLMGRRGTRKDYIRLIRNIRRRIPQIAIRTTFITGFPGETEENFYGLIDFIEDLRFDRLGVFKFSKEEGTPASRFKGQIPDRVKDRRFNEIMERQALISLERNRELIGKRYEAIIDEVDGDITVGRLYSHAPEIDGVVIIENNKDKKNQMPVKVGDIITVEIVDAFDYDLKAVIVENKK